MNKKQALMHTTKVAQSAGKGVEFKVSGAANTPRVKRLPNSPLGANHHVATAHKRKPDPSLARPSGKRIAHTSTMQERNRA